MWIIIIIIIIIIFFFFVHQACFRVISLAALIPFGHSFSGLDHILLVLSTWIGLLLCAVTFVYLCCICLNHLKQFAWHVVQQVSFLPMASFLILSIPDSCLCRVMIDCIFYVGKVPTPTIAFVRIGSGCVERCFKYDIGKILHCGIFMQINWEEKKSFCHKNFL